VSIWDSATVLITGGTGSFGKQLVQELLAEGKVAKIIVLSRDELKQMEMREMFELDSYSPLRFFLGDVRDQDRLYRAFRGVDIVIHAAALKQVPACEYNPFEAILTNIMGAKNIIDAAIDCGVPRVMGISTDKAVNPVNLYGATKLCAEKLLIQGNFYTGPAPTRISCVRYGNVLGSRGSVIPRFRQQKEAGVLRITDERMTRFWITLNQAVRFVMRCVEIMRGEEVFIPKIPSASLLDLAKAIAPECELEVTGIRPGEKLHEILISADEARNTVEMSDMYIVRPPRRKEMWKEGKPLPDGFEYCSNTNPWQLSQEEILKVLDTI